MNKKGFRMQKISVPLLDLNAQYKPIEDEVFAAFKEVFDSKRFIMGDKITELEEKIADYCQCKYAVGVTSGTDALILSLMALGIGPGDEVITTPFTFFATAGSIDRLGAIPVFVDIDSRTYNIDASLIEEKITPKTKAIMPVHIFGQMADMDKIMEIAGKHNLKVIEDAAQAIGSEYKGKRSGSMGDTGCFSFFPSKNLGCCGDGGIITTNDKDLAEKMRILRNHGSNPKYYHKFVGGNFRLDAIQAAILLVKLPYLEAQHKRRQENAAYYNNKLKAAAVLPVVADERRMIFNQYTIRVKDRDGLRNHLNESGIGNDIYYPLPLHLQECFSGLGYKKGDLPVSEKTADEVISLPIYSELTETQLDAVAKAIIEFSKDK